MSDEPRRGREPIPASEESEWPEDWEESAARRTISFYHAEGAPYLDDEGKVHAHPPAEDLEELRRQGLVIPPTIVEEIVGSVVPIRAVKRTPALVPARAAESPPERPRTEPDERLPEESGEEPGSVQEFPSSRLKQPMDLSMMEEIAYLVIRRVFREGVRIPIRKEGMVDLDVIIKGKELVIDVNRLFFDTPKLSVWRVTLAYMGEPLVLFGRGVKQDLKVHPLRVARFLIRAWMEKRRYEKQAELETTE
jgi:hypothetical protein